MQWIVYFIIGIIFTILGIFILGIVLILLWTIFNDIIIYRIKIDVSREIWIQKSKLIKDNE